MSQKRRSTVIPALCLVAAFAIASAACSQSEEPQPEATSDAAPAQSSGPAVVTVDGKPITEADIELAQSDLDPQFSRLPEEQRRAATVSALIEIKLLAELGRKNNLDETEEYKQRMSFLADRALHSAVVRSEVADKVTDEAVRTRFEEEVGSAAPTQEIKVRHILVKTEEEAKAIIDQLADGADFSDLAKDKSTGPSGPSGGDLGYIAKGVTVPEFEAAAFALEPGSYTDAPVKTSFGWHVIQVDDRRDKQPPTFESQQEQMRAMLLRDNYFALVRNLREAAEINFNDEQLKQSLDQLEAQQN